MVTTCGQRRQTLPPCSANHRHVGRNRQAGSASTTGGKSRLIRCPSLHAPLPKCAQPDSSQRAPNRNRRVASPVPKCCAPVERIQCGFPEERHARFFRSAGDHAERARAFHVGLRTRAVQSPIFVRHTRLARQRHVEERDHADQDVLAQFRGNRNARQFSAGGDGLRHVEGIGGHSLRAQDFPEYFPVADDRIAAQRYIRGASPPA